MCNGKWSMNNGLRILLLVGGTFIAAGAFFTGCSEEESSNPITNGGTTTTPDGWTVQVVDEKNGDQYTAAINGEINAVIDPQGKLHICYYDYTTSSLKYATNRSGAWVVTTIETSVANVNIVGEMNDIAVDQGGNAHLSYHNMDNNVSDANVETIRYATNASGSWTKSNVFTPASSVTYAENEICVDATGKVHLAFEGANSSIGYVSKTTGSWTQETAAQFPAFTTDMSMVLDASNAPVIAFTGNYGLYVVRRVAASNWQGGLVVGTVNVSEDANYPAIAVTPSGTQYVVYHDMDEDKVWLATNGALTELSATAGKGFFARSAITVDGGGQYHISYPTLNTSDWTLHYATNKTGSLVNTPLSIRTSSSGSAICVDNAGKVYIVYANHPRASLCVAWK